MAGTHFKGVVYSTNGFSGNLTGNVAGEVTPTSETVTGAGAISVTTSHTSLVTTGANALTLAVPTKPGMVKTIVMTTDGGDGTLASTNIVGQSSGSTSITFNDAGDALVLVALNTSKWCVVKEFGVTAA